MKQFIFFTKDTTQSHPLPIQTMLLLGYAHGDTVDDALSMFKQEQPYLLKCSFEEIMAWECVGDVIRDLRL